MHGATAIDAKREKSMTQAPVKWGLIFGVAVGVQNVIFAMAGWHKVYDKAFVYLAIAIAINVTAVVMCLRKTAARSSWAAQLGNGLVLGLVASAIIFASTWLVTAIIFPDYFVDMAEGYRSVYSLAELEWATTQERLAGVAAMSPVRSAAENTIGAMVVSLLTSAVAGIWLRRKTS